MTIINTVPMLLEAIENGMTPEYVYFWGHKHNPNKKINHSCLSQWYDCTFTENNITYTSAEQYMMAQKALLFNDTDIFDKIVKKSIT